MTAPLLEMRGISRRFSTGAPPALDGVDLTLGRAEVLGIVGASGSGKTTLARIAARLIAEDAGEVLFEGAPLCRRTGLGFARDPRRRAIQMVFQDPLGSLNPRFRARAAIGDPLRCLGTRAERREIAARVDRAASRAGLPEALLDAYPHRLSGGQLARVGLARALVLAPKLIILDEPTAALDAPLRAHAMRSLLDLRREIGCALILVSHDLGLVRGVADRLMVMDRGRVVEHGPAARIFDAPEAAETRGLIAAIPRLGRRWDAPSVGDPPGHQG